MSLGTPIQGRFTFKAYIGDSESDLAVPTRLLQEISQAWFLDTNDQ
jgi:hypothetical protein